MTDLQPCAPERPWAVVSPGGLQESSPFPIKWISEKWRDGYYITSMAHFQTCWAIAMSKNSGFVDQIVELDFQHPSEGYLKWATGGKAFALACTLPQVCLGQKGVWPARLQLARSGRETSHLMLG